jgi:glycosyltransferase involved in cell wall biosynthesis
MAEVSVSVVMPVHVGVRPDYLASAVESVLCQTVAVDEIVVVEDGPLTDRQLGVLDEALRGDDRVVRVRLPVNRGAGVANQAGLEAASGEWIMKTDADDINLPHRLETQLEFCLRHGIDVCGSAMIEFHGDPQAPVGLRQAPGSMAEIRSRMRFNNPMNHPTVIYRRDLALRVGGYPAMRYMQDYDLFARMAAGGAQMANLSVPLVKFRGGSQMRRRRRGLEILWLDWELQRRLKCYGIIGWGRVVRNMCIRMAFRITPDGLSRLVYRRVLSRPFAATSSTREKL